MTYLPAHVSIRLTPGARKTLNVSTMLKGRFSVSASLISSGGQVLEEVLKEWRPSWLVSYPDLKQLVRYWRVWHLNDMHAGTPEQEEALKAHFGKENVDYDIRCKYLDTLGLYIHNGYKYGSGWLMVELPQEVREWTNNFIEKYRDK